MSKYILIKSDSVKNIIIADESFIEAIKDDYDAIIDYDICQQNISPNDYAFQDEVGKWHFRGNVVEYIESEVLRSEETKSNLSIEGPVIDLVE